MKIRSDFVSNSSSSSFVVYGSTGDVSLLAQKLDEMLSGISIPWDFSNCVEVCLKAKNKNYKEVWEAFKDEKCRYESWYVDCNGKKKKKDPEELSWESIRVDLDRFMAAASSPIIGKIDEVWFEAVDENSYECNSKLALLYKFFDAIGCNPDDSVSERAFLEEDDEFYKIMKDTISAKGKYIS